MIVSSESVFSYSPDIEVTTVTDKQHEQAGWLGSLVAGFCFILPAAIMVTAIAWAYVMYGSLGQVADLFYGIKPVIIAIILQALWGLGRGAAKSWFLAACGVVALSASILGVSPLLVYYS